MNTISAIEIEYLRPSRTIEVILISNPHTSKLVYVYNYEGNSFRVFLSSLKLIGFFCNLNEADEVFDFDEELDEYLLSII